MNEQLISRIVAEVVRRLRALEGGRVARVPPTAHQLVTEDVVLDAAKRSADTVGVAKGAIVTPLARDMLRREGIRLVAADPNAQAQPPEPSNRGRVIILGANHRGVALKEALKASIQGIGREVVDRGAYSPQESSFVEIARRVGTEVAQNGGAMGILVDGCGAGSALVANRIQGVRAVACHDVTGARMARAHLDANVLCLGAGVVGDTLAEEIVATWLTTPFEGGAHSRRVREIDAAGGQPGEDEA